ncbi:hypothetical protein PSACC_00172 [Paramicrosporidium saccamoebae]|uniref:Small-subunit processome Utp12 domain-containing protein n=1 Tax=Paramicrosporidium saccamoebae TaxID=1246581 RepID=A0A2H9TQK3_9FUNG|nr:hypothetical protein PSACC_00172 [Paramicrosporidium saccamoebae]
MVTSQYTRTGDSDSDRMTKDEILTEPFPTTPSPDGFIDPTAAFQKLPTPRVHSLCDILTQSLTSSDSDLLENALSNTDTDLIRSSLRRMPPTYALPLLDALVVRIQRRPMRAMQLVPWLRLLLTEHAAYLLTVPDLPSRVEPLQKLIEARTKTHRRMVMLRGRIQLMLGQVNGRGEQEDFARLMEMPVATYDDSEDDDEGVEVITEQPEEEYDDELESGEEEDMDEEMDEDVAENSDSDASDSDTSDSDASDSDDSD